MELSNNWSKPETIKAVAAGIISGIASLFLTAGFQDQMPMAEWFYNLRSSFLFPLTAADLVFHEAGHWIFGILGIRFITVAGGTIMQLIFPVACLVNFAKFQKNRWGVLFAVFWIGYNLMEIAWYVADAKVQGLLLISGMTGREGGGHDWGNMLGWLGLTNDCVGMGEFTYWIGLTLFVFPLPWLLIYFWNRFVKVTA